MTARVRLGRRIAPRLRPSALPLARKTMLLTGISLAVAAFGASTASASAQQYALKAHAYGTRVLVGKTVRSGPSALVSLGCTSSVGVRHTNTAASVNVPHAIATGTIDTVAMSKAIKTGIASRGSATTQDANLLNGLITATTVRAVSTTKHNTSTGAFSETPAGTTFVNLVVNGHKIGGTPAANTKIALPGVGYVILNQETFSTGGASPGLTVIGIHLVVTHTSNSAVAGTQVFVSVANSSISGPEAGLLHGLAFGTSAVAGHTVIAGDSFPESLGCLGTNGATETNSGASVNVPDVLRTGTITDTAYGTETATEVFGKMTSTVHHLNLLGGKVTATAIRAKVTANGNPPTLGDHSSFVDLKVQGAPNLGGNPAPNTKIPLSGYGTLWLHRRIKTSSGIKVIMIQLVITKTNPAKLPIGATIDVGYAGVGVS